MTDITTISDPNKIFTLDEAMNLLPLVLRITEKHENVVAQLLKDQWWLTKSGASIDKINSYDLRVSKELLQWGTKITKLGAKAFHSGFVGFNSGCFYWSWHLGDDKISHYHGYDESPLNRRALNIVTGTDDV